MQIIDNINTTVKGDLQSVIHKGSKLSIAAACFSIYAYQELKKQLEGIDELRFIFTSPTFVTERTPKAQREFYIPRISRERSLYGTEFEVKLRNEGHSKRERRLDQEKSDIQVQCHRRTDDGLYDGRSKHLYAHQRLYYG